MRQTIKPIKSTITVDAGEPLTITASNKFSFEFIKNVFDDCHDTETTFSEEGYVAIVRPLHGITSKDVIKHMLDNVDCYFDDNGVKLEFKGVPKDLTSWNVIKAGKNVIRFISSLDSQVWLAVLFIGSAGFSLILLLPIGVVDVIFTITWCSAVVISFFGIIVAITAAISAMLD